MTPCVAIVVPSWNTRELLRACLRSIADTREDLSLETIVVDNGSTDGSPEMVRMHFPDVRVIQNADNVGFARACNQGIAATTAPYALLLNSDAELLPGTLRTMVALADTEPRCGVVGARLCFPDGRFQSSHASFPTLWREMLILTGIGRLLFGPWYPSHGPEIEPGPRTVDWVGGACLLVRGAAFNAIGGLDDRFFMYAEETDLCYRMQRQGWSVWYHPQATALHAGGGSTSAARRVVSEFNLYRGRLRFMRKHYGRYRAGLFLLQLGLFTSIKRAVHGTLHWISRGRYGHAVVPLRQLARLIRDDG